MGEYYMGVVQVGYVLELVDKNSLIQLCYSCYFGEEEMNIYFQKKGQKK